MAAIDVDHLARDERAGVAREQHAGRGELVDLAEPAEGDFGQNLVARLMHILRPVAHRVDRAR